MALTLPVWVLLAFAVWTILVLMMTVGIYRWGMIFTGRAKVTDFSADGDEGSALYRRSMRAHLNCLESLPVYGAIVLVIVVSGAGSSTLDTLALILLGARIAQTLIHIATVQTAIVAYVRFGFFFTQLVCMLWMATLVALPAL